MRSMRKSSHCFGQSSVDSAIASRPSYVLASGTSGALDQHQVRRRHPVKHGHVTTLNGFETVADHINPLLRHRTRSISRGPGGASARAATHSQINGRGSLFR